MTGLSYYEEESVEGYPLTVYDRGIPYWDVDGQKPSQRSTAIATSGREVVAQARTLSELRSLVGEMELPKGARVEVILDLKLPLGWAFDTVIGEWLSKGFVPDGMDLVDVRKLNSSAGIIELEADPAWLLAIIAFMKAHWIALTIAGFALWVVVSMITVTVKLPGAVSAPFWLIGGVAIGVVGLMLLTKKPGYVKT